MRNEIEIRQAIESDYMELLRLFDEIFGSVYEDELDYRIKNEIIVVALDGGKIVGSTGINSISRTVVNGYEVSWTFVIEEYRGNNLTYEMLKKCIEDTRINKRIPLYLSDWHFSWKDKSNLNSLIDKMNFKLVIPKYKSYNEKHFKICSECPYKKDNCKCFEDLYITKME